MNYPREFSEIKRSYATVRTHLCMAPADGLGHETFHIFQLESTLGSLAPSLPHVKHKHGPIQKALYAPKRMVYLLTLINC